MCINSGLISSSAVPTLGSRAILQIGQEPSSSGTSSGCIGIHIRFWRQQLSPQWLQCHATGGTRRRSLLANLRPMHGACIFDICVRPLRLDSIRSDARQMLPWKREVLIRCGAKLLKTVGYKRSTSVLDNHRTRRRWPGPHSCRRQDL